MEFLRKALNIQEKPNELKKTMKFQQNYWKFKKNTMKSQTSIQIQCANNENPRRNIGTSTQ